MIHDSTLHQSNSHNIFILKLKKHVHSQTAGVCSTFFSLQPNLSPQIQFCRHCGCFIAQMYNLRVLSGAGAAPHRSAFFSTFSILTLLLHAAGESGVIWLKRCSSCCSLPPSLQIPTFSALALGRLIKSQFPRFCSSLKRECSSLWRCSSTFHFQSRSLNPWTLRLETFFQISSFIL